MTTDPKTALDAKGWHDFLIRLAIQAYERASLESGLRSGHSRAFAKHVQERFAQAAQTLAGELPRHEHVAHTFRS